MKPINTKFNCILLIIALFALSFSNTQATKITSSEMDKSNEDQALSFDLASDFNGNNLDDDWDTLEFKLVNLLSKKELGLLFSLFNSNEISKRDNGVKRPFNPQTSI